MPDILTACRAAVPETVALLKQLAALESPSSNKAAVDACSAFVAARLHELGVQVEVVPQAATGQHLKAAWPSAQDSLPGFLTLCHLDTVWPLGTLACTRVAPPSSATEVSTAGSTVASMPVRGIFSDSRTTGAAGTESSKAD